MHERWDSSRDWFQCQRIDGSSILIVALDGGAGDSVLSGEAFGSVLFLILRGSRVGMLIPLEAYRLFLLLPDVIERRCEVGGVRRDSFVRFWQVCHFLTNYLTYCLFRNADFLSYGFLGPACEPEVKDPLVPGLLRILVNPREPLTHSALGGVSTLLACQLLLTTPLTTFYLLTFC